jgi:hypothetical protein
MIHSGGAIRQTILCSLSAQLRKSVPNLSIADIASTDYRPDFHLPFTRILVAATGGVHSAEYALKLIMAGADVTMLASALMRHGIEQLKVIEQDMRDPMELYESVMEMQGTMSHKNGPDPEVFERVNYIRGLQGYKVMG